MRITLPSGRFFAYVVLLLPIVGYSQSREDEVLKIVNLVRSNPRDFLSSYVTPYLEKKNLTKNKYAKSLINDLSKCSPISTLKSSHPLANVARQHALDMGKAGTVGHTSSDGTLFSDRLRKRAKAGGMIAENCDYGNEEPLDIVMALLIDDGIKSLGHRKNILEPAYRWVGIAIEKHKTYRVNCVMDFAESVE